MAAKEVILARTHPFIVDHMKAFLARNGYQPRPLQDLAELKALSAGSIAGVVISTSVVAGNTGESHADVLKAARAALPNTPVLLATLLAFDAIKRNLEPVLPTISPGARLVAVGPGSDREAGLGGAGALVVVHRDDLASPERAVHADATIKRHFG